MPKFLDDIIVDGGAKLGIGTASPGVKLHLKDETNPYQLRLESTGTESWNIGIGKTSYYDNTLLFQYGGVGDKMALTSTGNLGIGELNPTRKLEIVGTYGRTELDGHFIEFTRASANYLWASAAGGDLRFTVNGNAIGSPSMILDSGGKLGIGTTSPFSKLSINSNGAPTTSGNVATTGLTIHNGTGGTAVQIGTYDAGSYNYIQSNYVNNAGVARELRLMVGAVNSLKLDTSGNATFSGTITGSSNASFGSDTNAQLIAGRGKIGAYVSDYVYFSHIDYGTSSNYALNQSHTGNTSVNAKTGGSVALKINNSAKLTLVGDKIGIGTASPSSYLDVVGDADVGVIQVSHTSNGAYGSILFGSINRLTGDNGNWYLKNTNSNTTQLTLTDTTATFAGTVNIVGTNSTNQESVLLRGITANGGDLLGSIRTANTGGYNQEMRFYTSNANGATDEDLTLTLKPDQSATFAGNIATASTKKVLFDGASGHTYITEESDSNLKFYVAGTEQLNITNGGLHFNASLTIPDYINHAGDAGTKFGFDGDDTFTVRTGGAVRLTVTDTDVTTAQNFTSSGYIQAHNYLYLRNHIQLLNKAANNWLQFATRNTSASEAVYDLAHIGTLTASGEIEGGSLDINGAAAINGKVVIEGDSAAWNVTTPGATTGSLHFDPGATTNDFGNAITFGASDSSNGTTGQAGIYVRSDGAYGTRMYFATTNDYATGSKTAFYINNDLQVYFNNNIVVAGELEATSLDINGNVDFDQNLNAGAFLDHKNSNSGTSAYTSIRIQNDTGNAEIWRNSSTRSQTGGAAQSLNIYNTQDTNIWSGSTRALHLDTSQNATFAGSVAIQSDNDNRFLVRSNDYTISRIISRGNTGTNLDKGLFSLMSSDGTNNNVEKVRIDSAGSSWFNGGAVSFGGDITSTSNIESQDTFILNYNNAGNKWQQLFDGSNGWNLRYYNGSSWSSNYINVNTSGNATFAGNAEFTGNITANGNINGDGSTNVGNMNNVTTKQLIANGASLKIGDQQSATITMGKQPTVVSGVPQNDATDVIIANNLTVTKKLLIQGELETETTTNTIIKDNVIQLNDGGNSANTKDSGIVIHRGTSQNVAIVWDEDGQTAGGAFRFIATGDTASSADVSMTPQNENGENVIGGASALGFQDVFAAHFRAVGAGNTSGFVGDGSGVTNLNMGNASSGTLAAARGGTGITTFSNADYKNSNVTSVSGSSGSCTGNAATATALSTTLGLTTVSMTFQLAANTWTDTGIDGTDLATGTYAMQVFVDDHNAGGGHYDEYYSATISWYAGSTNSTNVDEIVTHNAGHASNASHLQIRTLRAVNSDSHDLMLQVKQNFAHNTALNGTDGKTMTFKFRRLI